MLGARKLKSAVAAAAVTTAAAALAIGGRQVGAVTVPGGCSYTAPTVTSTYTTQVNLTVPAGVTRCT